MLALTAASLLVAGCSATQSGAPDKDSAVTDGAPASPQLTVRGADDGNGGDAPSAVARPGGGHAGRLATKSALKVASFDRNSGRAVITTAAVRPSPGKPSASSGAPSGSPSSTPSGAPTNPPSSGSPSAAASASASPSPTSSASPSAAPSKGGASPKADVAAGDIIASAPAPGAPQGVLAKVTKVVATTDRGTEVTTAPATLDALLGGSTAHGAVPVDPASVKVEPLAPKVKVSWARTGGLHFGPKGAQLPLGRLRLDVGASLPTPSGGPVSAKASATGYVQLAPEVDFSYEGGRGGGVGGASLTLSGRWSSQWEFKGRAAASTEAEPLRVPFAKLHADPVIQVGPVPVVVNLDLTCYLQVDADGKASVDVKQDLKGDFTVGGTYRHAKGWAPVAKATMHGTPVRATAAAAGKVKAALGTEASLGLYGSVGVTADVAPYLRAEVAGTASAATDGTASATGSWAAFGGVDLSGALRAHLDIFGTPIFDRRIPLGPLNREWKLAAGKRP
ncbi:hypothetical protein [Streptomyces natalensis]|uniref:hypothetical protein n=1 Tax=Streptomyces natalensis TaxID=68242 RepID=UPI000AA79AC8|nr:hypothetical protein [Streptomyces natalensis]